MKFILLIFFVTVTVFSSCSKSTEEIRVADFGAIPNDTKDDTPSILSAIEACKNKKNYKLVFEPGRYDIYGSKKDERGNWDPAIVINDISNLTFEGNGSEFIGHDYSTMFHFTGCRNISITNLTVDWDPLPYTQGKVMQVDSNSIDIEVIAPFVAQQGLHTEAIIGYDTENQRMERRFTDHYQLGYEKTTEVIRPGVMRLFIGRKDRFAGTMPLVGQYVIARSHVYGYQSFEFVKCTECH